MKPTIKLIQSEAARFSFKQGGIEMARAWLYLIRNDLHKAPYGYVEDVFVAPEARGKGMGKELVRVLIEAAMAKGCYKLLACSRDGKPEVHAMYEKLGFRRHGVEFRMDFKEK